jgi:serine/threonine protein kinase
VFQDKRYKNREFELIKLLNHPNVIVMKDAYYTQGEGSEDVYLNIVTDYIPDTLYKALKTYRKQKQLFPNELLKIYSYQLFRSLAYIHGIGICHRDIKPQNVLVNPETFDLRMCDLGSAKKLVKGEPNIAYICSRYYRAPELIFQCTDYSNAIDVWSTGCVIAELMLSEPIFPGDSAIDQIVKIIKILGSPTHDQIKAMNPENKEYKIPNVK